MKKLIVNNYSVGMIETQDGRFCAAYELNGFDQYLVNFDTGKEYTILSEERNDNGEITSVTVEDRELHEKTINDVWGRTLKVYDGRKKLVTFNNKEKCIRYSAPIVEGSGINQYWTDWTEETDVDDILDRLDSVLNPVKTWYAFEAVKLNAKENDPNGDLWRKTVDIVKKYENAFFDENGDFRSDESHYLNIQKPLLDKLVLGKEILFDGEQEATIFEYVDGIFVTDKGTFTVTDFDKNQIMDESTGSLYSFKVLRYTTDNNLNNGELGKLHFKLL